MTKFRTETWSRRLCGAMAIAVVTYGLASPALADTDTLDKYATGYQRYAAQVERLGAAPPRSGSEIRKALAQLTKESPDAIAQGWIADAAVSAAEEPNFRAAVLAAASAEGTAELERRLIADPHAIMSMKGVENGYRRILDGVKSDEHQFRGLESILSSLARGKRAGPLAALAPQPRPKPTNAVLTTASAPAVQMPAWSRGVTSDPGIGGRMMTLAALDVLAHAHGTTADPATVSRLVSSDAMNGCLTWARLNLNQCEAAAHGTAELTYCAATHAVGDVASCFAFIVPGGY